METYHIGCYWNNREEGVDACADRAVRYLKQLAACDPVFAKVLVSSKAQESPHLVSADSKVLKPLFEDKTLEKWGCRISFVSDHKDRDEQWSTHIRCGASPKKAGSGWPNFCMPMLPTKGPSLKTLLKPTTLSCLMRAMVAAWEPDWAVVYDDAVLDGIYQRAGIPAAYSQKRTFLGWMTYFASRIGKVPEGLPVHSRTELGEGTLLVLSQDPIAVEHPGHVAAAKRTFQGLQEAGLIPA
jgi:hypothetical protein